MRSRRPPRVTNAMRSASALRFFSLTALLVISVAPIARAEPAQRAKPPAWTDDQRELFPTDARKLLVGPRPDFGQMVAAASQAQAGSPEQAEPATEYRWSEVISTATLETEIKRQATEVSQLVGSATAFKGGGYRKCRNSFSVLAVMFAISAEHDEGARWRDKAAGLAALFARAGSNCKVGTDASFREAAARGEDLAALVRGGRPDVPEPKPDQNWGSLADRSPLMRRMEQAQQERLQPLLGSAREFSRGAEDALHEAQVLAALAELLTRDGFEDAEDDDYANFARALRDGAGDLSRAADNDNYEAARAAAGKASQSCSECHENYRG